MAIRIDQIDAFASRPFTGNPAAVCVLDEPRDDPWMQAVAMEMAISETAFLHGSDDEWDLRWFTPRAEVDLCGHGTLAAAHHLWSSKRSAASELRFATRSGMLSAQPGDSGWIALDLPAAPTEPATPPGTLLEALGDIHPVAVERGEHDYLIELPDADAVRSLDPDFRRLASVASVRGVIVTAVGDGLHDIISRYFAPALGIDEDPVTGSAHCSLGPYWAGRLAKDDLLAHQASRRGGEMRVTVANDRIRLEGRAVTTLTGELTEAADSAL